MGNGITLGQASRESLLSLKSTKAMANKAASRISTGLKVATASDDAVSYFQAASLTDRSKDFLALKNGIDQGISTLSAALDSTTAVESMAKQMKGLVLSTAGMTTQQRADVALQWDDFRNQITSLANDAVYDGVSLLTNPEGFSVDVSPAGEVKVEVPGRDLRTNGGVVDDIAAVWADDSDGDGTYKLARRNFTASIDPKEDESIDSSKVVIINPPASNFDSNPMISRLTNSNIVMSWSDSSNTSYIRILDANGAQIGADIRINNGIQVCVTSLIDGGFAAAWRSTSSGKTNYSIFDDTGTVKVPATPIGTNGSWYSSIGATSNGGFIVAWSAFQDGSSFGTYSTAFDSTGNAVSGVNLVNQITIGQQSNPSVVGLVGGGAVITWYDNTLGGRARLVDSDGNMVGNEFDVIGANGHSKPNAAHLKDGGFVVVFGGNGFSASCQVYNANGAPRSNIITIDAIVGSESPKVDALTSGGFAVSWTSSSNDDGSGYGCYMKTYDSQGTALVGKTLINQTTANNQNTPAIASASLADLLNTESGELEIRKASCYGNFATAADRDRATKDIDAAIDTIRSAAGHFVSSMNLLSTRVDFAKNYASTLSAGAGKLTLADLNEESANLLALQSRSQLGVQALTFATQSEQAILKIMK